MIYPKIPIDPASAVSNGGSSALSGGLPSVSTNATNSQFLAAKIERTIPPIAKTPADDLMPYVQQFSTTFDGMIDRPVVAGVCYLFDRFAAIACFFAA
jgi:hypothetical protein